MMIHNFYPEVTDVGIGRKKGHHMDRRNVESKMAGERGGREKRSTGATYVSTGRLKKERGGSILTAVLAKKRKKQTQI